MGPESLISLILVLAVLGFALWLLFKYVPMVSPIREIIMCIIAIAVILWLLSQLGIWHGATLHR